MERMTSMLTFPMQLSLSIGARLRGYDFILEGFLLPGPSNHSTCCSLERGVAMRLNHATVNGSGFPALPAS
jgi:hypothetical protein